MKSAPHQSLVDLIRHGVFLSVINLVAGLTGAGLRRRTIKKKRLGAG